MRAPLKRVPENTLKFVVGIMLTSFGTFWAGEGFGYNWPLADVFILILVALYLVASFILITWLKQVKLQQVAMAAARKDTMITAEQKGVRS